MVRSTIIARLSDGLPLAASTDDDELVEYYSLAFHIDITMTLTFVK